jgi:hypothetical protein
LGNSYKLIKLQGGVFILCVVGLQEKVNVVYKIPFGVSMKLNTDFQYKSNRKQLLYFCTNTCYFERYSPYANNIMDLDLITISKFDTYKPVYFSKLTYKGKGFKLFFKKKKNFFNCIFGHSHIY